MDAVNAEQAKIAEEAGAVAAPTLVRATVDVDPDKLNIRSRGEFVTAFLGLPEGVDPANVGLTVTALEGVPAVSDDTYGFVEDIPVSNRQGTPTATVRFPRDDLSERLSTGTSEV